MEAAFIPEVNDELDTQNFEKFEEVRITVSLHLASLKKWYSSMPFLFSHMHTWVLMPTFHNLFFLCKKSREVIVILAFKHVIKALL